MNTTANNSCNVTTLFHMLSCCSERCNLCIHCMNGVQNWTCTLEWLNGSMKDSCCHGKVQHWLRTDGNKITAQRVPLNSITIQTRTVHCRQPQGDNAGKHTLRALMTVPSFSTTPDALFLSSRIWSTCAFSFTWPPCFFTPLQHPHMSAVSFSINNNKNNLCFCLLQSLFFGWVYSQNLF